jgi:ATP/maltotriose-dependent transcriptional regulator MalT
VRAALLHERADIESARAAYEAMAEMAREPEGNTFWVAAQVGLATVVQTQGDLGDALERLSRISCVRGRDKRSTTQRWVDRATILTHLRLGQVHAAREVLGPPPWGWTEMRVAVLVALAEGRADEAERLSSSLRQTLPRPRLFAAIVESRVALLRGDRVASSAGARRVMEIAQEHGFVRSVLDFGAELLPSLAAATTSVADAEFVARLHEAATLGIAAVGDGRTGWESIGLSGRELDVLRYLATHLSTREIAHALHVSRNTVKSHKQHVYRKLAVSTREAAVARARTLQLLR